MSRLSAAILLAFFFVSAALCDSHRRRHHDDDDDDDHDDDDHHRHRGWGGRYCAAFIVGGVVGVTTLVIVIVCCCKRHNAKKLKVNQVPDLGKEQEAGPLPQKGAMLEPPPYTSSLPVYSVPLPSGHEKSAEGLAPYPPLHRPEEAFAPPERTFSPPPAYELTLQPQHPPPHLPPIRGNPGLPRVEEAPEGRVEGPGENTPTLTPGAQPSAPRSDNI